MGSLVKVWAVVTVTMFIGTGALLAAVRLSYRDPFAPYRAVMPGQSIDALQGYPCQFRASARSATAFGSCQFNAGEGALREIMLTVFHHVITEMTAFDIQPDALRVGDLIACWSTPADIEPAYRTYAEGFMNMYWNDQIRAQISTGHDNTHLDYFTSISFLSIDSTWKPCRS